ncbi:MAG: diguanylate cyclase [Gammaproteobacteria bacterium]
MNNDTDYRKLFEMAPVSLWLEDYTGVKATLDDWRASGVTNLRAFLREHPEEAGACAARIRVLEVNRKTLEMFAARDIDHLVANLDKVFRDDMHERFIEDLVQMWRNGPYIRIETVNYTLEGKRLDISLNTAPLAGHEHNWDRVLVSIEDITERARAQRNLARSEQYARGLFEHSPVSLWVEDFSGVKRLLDGVRAQGITDFRTFLNVHPEFINRCTQEIRVMDVNQQTLTMFAAPSKETLLLHLDEVFRGETHIHFTEQLIDLWNGKLFQQREALNYSLTGEQVNVYLQFSVLPGYEQSWELVLVSLTDITARKRAEAYLEFLGKHDSLTKLRNRAYYDDEIVRLQRKGPFPIGVVMMDLNGLKIANDELGHAAGDSLLRRAGEALKKAVGDQVCAARVGGDEFALLLPAHDAHAVEQVIERMQMIVDLNNQFYQGARLSFSIGYAVCASGQRLEDTLREADERMYKAKHEHYAQLGLDRRHT